MQIYRGMLRLLDYLFYATVERGKIYETGAFVHNYALTYALGLVQSENYTYSSLKQQPGYGVELSPLNGQIYLTPATPVGGVTHRLVQWNTLPERYAFPGKPPSIGYPDWGFARVLRPENEFIFYVLINDNTPLQAQPTLSDMLAGHPTRIRLGKFNGKARLTLQKADKIKDRTGSFVSYTLLNWRDVTIDPVVCDVVTTSLPTRLINHSRFEDADFYEAIFGDDVIQLPQAMHYLGRPLRTQSKQKQK